MAKKRTIPDLAVVLAVGFAACVLLFAYSVLKTHSLAYAFLVFNVVLAAIPLALSCRLVRVLKYKRWSSWEPLLTTIVWLIFLPNSFYMVSDYIHLQSMSNSTILYNAVMFTSFIFLALFMGMVSLYQVHNELRRRISRLSAVLLIGVVLIGCSFAIYLGRDLRWNSWDVVLNPGGLLFDVSNLILKPEAYPDMLRTMASFFVLLGSMYAVSWYAAKRVWQKGVNDLAVHLRKRNNA